MTIELTTTIGTRINLELLGDINLELKRTGKKMAQWIKEAVEEKLQNDNSEVLEAEIQFVKSKLSLLEKRKLSIKDKVDNLKQIPSSEIPFLLQTKKLLISDPTFIKGRINLYKNKFSKTYKISDQDFYDLTWAYLLRCKEDNVIHTEIFFDPQTHTERGIQFDTVINGIHKALMDGHKELGVSSQIIMCFLKSISDRFSD